MAKTRNQDPFGEPNPEKRRGMYFSLFLSSFSPSGRPLRAAARRMRTGGPPPWNICRAALVECSFAAFAEGPRREREERERNGKESRGEEKVSSRAVRDGPEKEMRRERERERERRERRRRIDAKGFRRRGWSMKGPRYRAATPFSNRKQSRILTLIYRAVLLAALRSAPLRL